MDNYTQFTYAQIETAQGKVNNGIFANLHEALKFIYNERQQEIEVEIAERNKLNHLRELDPRNMTKEEVIKATWQMPPLSKDLYDMLISDGFQTGSGALGYTNSKDEDWCINMPPHVFYEYTIGQSDHGYFEADGFSSIYCHYNGRLFNILCFGDFQLYKAWLYTTEMMQRVQRDKLKYLHFSVDLNDVLATKWKRVILFRAFKDIFYEPLNKRPMDKLAALNYNKCAECGRETLYFTCRAAKDHYLASGQCERCSGIEY